MAWVAVELEALVITAFYEKGTLGRLRVSLPASMRSFAQHQAGHACVDSFRIGGGAMVMPMSMPSVVSYNDTISVALDTHNAVLGVENQLRSPKSDDTRSFVDSKGQQLEVYVAQAGYGTTTMSELASKTVEVVLRDSEKVVVAVCYLRLLPITKGGKVWMNASASERGSAAQASIFYNEQEMMRHEEIIARTPELRSTNISYTGRVPFVRRYRDIGTVLTCTYPFYAAYGPHNRCEGKEQNEENERFILNLMVVALQGMGKVAPEAIAATADVEGLIADAVRPRLSDTYFLNEMLARMALLIPHATKYVPDSTRRRNEFVGTDLWTFPVDGPLMPPTMPFSQSPGDPLK